MMPSDFENRRLKEQEKSYEGYAHLATECLSDIQYGLPSVIQEIAAVAYVKDDFAQMSKIFKYIVNHGTDCDISQFGSYSAQLIENNKPNSYKALLESIKGNPRMLCRVLTFRQDDFIKAIMATSVEGLKATSKLVEEIDNTLKSSSYYHEHIESIFTKAKELLTKVEEDHKARGDEAALMVRSYFSKRAADASSATLHSVRVSGNK